LDGVIQGRVGQRQMGYGANIQKQEEKKFGELLESMESEDLLKYGLIPEFVGRLPVVATLHELDEEALVQILTEPRNALVKQYQKLFRMDGIELKLQDDALRAIAHEALGQKSGARGLRSILERALMDVMYDSPSDESIKEILVNADVIRQEGAPIIVGATEAESA
ncbi:MAG: ATP-dependent Clp protease ATP-binding subunit ClpX, partial [Myxococcota bacterium]